MPLEPDDEPPRDPDNTPHDPSPDPPTYGIAKGPVMRVSVVMTAPTLVDGRPT